MQNGKDKMVVISGIGARKYFRKLRYNLVLTVKDMWFNA